METPIVESFWEKWDNDPERKKTELYETRLIIKEEEGYVKALVYKAVESMSYDEKIEFNKALKEAMDEGIYKYWFSKQSEDENTDGDTRA